MYFISVLAESEVGKHGKALYEFSHRNSVRGLVCGFEKGLTSSLVQLQK